MLSEKVPELFATKVTSYTQEHHTNMGVTQENTRLNEAIKKKKKTFLPAF